MSLWILILIISIIFLILEMFTPTLFFINLSLASFVAAVFAYLGYPVSIVTFVFFIVSIFAILLIRPLLLNQLDKIEQKTGIEDKYIGKTAKVVKEISADDGRISIYGEEWQAKTNDSDATIPVGVNVKIVSIDSIIFTVEKIKEC